MSAAQKASLVRLAEDLGKSASAYSRLALDHELSRGDTSPAVRRVAAAEPPDTSARLAFRIGERAYAGAARRAEELGVSLSAYLRAVLSIPLAQAPEGAEAEARYVDAKACLKELRALRNELSRIGNNVNQIAYGINLMAKKQWLSEREARPLFTRWAADTARAEAGLQEAGAAILSCMAALSGAEAEFVPLGGDGQCPL